MITGSAGFLGQALSPILVAAGHEVFAVVRPGAGGLIRHGTAIEIDLSRPLADDCLPPDIDAIVHLAQSRRFREFPAGADDVFAVNIASTAALLRYALATGVRYFTLASTGSIYAPSVQPIAEDGKIEPGDFYSASKCAAEALVRSYADYMNICILRYFNLYGPGQSAMLVPNLIAAIRRGETICVPEDSTGQLLLNPTYVDDAAAITHRAIKDSWSGIWNIAAPAVALGDLVESLAQRLGLSANIEIQRIIEPPGRPANADRLSRLGLPSGFRSLKEGLDALFDGQVDLQ